MNSPVATHTDLNQVGAQWLRDIAGGDEQALSAFYDATLSRCYALAYRITRRRESAEEVVSDTYLQVWREAARFDPERGRPLTWLLRICYSRAIDHLRRRGPEQAYADVESLVADEPDPVGDPLSLVLALENKSAVSEAVRKLPPVAQQLLGLAFFRGLTHQEIAEHTRLPLGTVKTHLRQALITLRNTLGEQS